MESVDADVMSQPQGQAQGAEAAGTAKVKIPSNTAYTEYTFVVKDRTMYIKQPDGSYQSVGPAEKIYDPGVILDKDLGLAAVISKVQNPKVDGKDTINGVAVVKISGTIDAAVVDKVVPKLGEGATTLPITLYTADVAPAATPTSIASDAPSPGTGPNLVRFVVTKDQGNVQVTLSNWGKPVTIPNPTG
jgi:hypothetical protein